MRQGASELKNPPSQHEKSQIENINTCLIMILESFRFFPLVLKYRVDLADKVSVMIQLACYAIAVLALAVAFFARRR